MDPTKEEKKEPEIEEYNEEEDVLQELFNVQVEHLVPIFCDLFFEGDTTYLCPHYFIAERILPLFNEMEERLTMEKEELEGYLAKASQVFEPDIWKEIESYLPEPFYCQIVDNILPIREDFFHQVWSAIVDTFLLVGLSREELYASHWGYFSVEELYKHIRHEDPKES